MSTPSVSIKPLVAVALASLCAAVGLFAVRDTVIALATLWRIDDLKSMGLVIPFLSAALILRSWRQIGWRFRGTWWGLALLVALSGILYLNAQTLFILTLHRDWLIQFPPLPVVACVYALSLVLLFGGLPLVRAAWFPIALMLLVIPVPGVFSRAVDLPLQHASATVARAFAHALGEPLTQDKLRLMFTPNFGMFIAPGCNGIRGAVTLGLSALVVGYLYRFRLGIHVAVIAGAVLLGYLFNFLRLCLLVIYYKLALPYPWLQDRAAGADYLIGGALFLFALYLFFTVANRLRRQPEDLIPDSPDAPAPARIPAIPIFARTAAVFALAAVFAIDNHHQARADALRASSRPAAVAFPQQIGGWTLQRTWTENLIDGSIIYSWAEYRAPVDGSAQSGALVSLGISPTLGLHDASVCHLARGDQPVLVEGMETPTPAGPITFSASLYSDGNGQRLEAATICTGGACHQFAQTAGNARLVYSQPRQYSPFLPNKNHPVPVLLTADMTDASVHDPEANTRLMADIRAFLAHADLPALTAPYSTR